VAVYEDRKVEGGGGMDRTASKSLQCAIIPIECPFRKKVDKPFIHLCMKGH